MNTKFVKHILAKWKNSDYKLPIYCTFVFMASSSIGIGIGTYARYLHNIGTDNSSKTT